MCCSSAPAEFTGTTLYIGEAVHPETGKLIHVMGYQNTPQNKSDGPNAMILHFPSAQPMSRQNILDTSKAKNILKDMVEAVRPRTRGFSFGLENSRGLVAKGVVEVFEHDVYTIVLAQYPTDILAALERVPADRRPVLKQNLLNYYETRFPNWSIALCCFNNRDAQEAAPMLWWYEPKNPAVLMAPALDAHDGNPPNEHANVPVDTYFIVGSHKMDLGVGLPVHYQDDLNPLRAFLPNQVKGRHFGPNMENGDFVAEVAAVRSDPHSYGRGMWRARPEELVRMMQTA